MREADSKAKIHRIANELKIISGMPYKTKEEQAQEIDYKKTIQLIIDQTEFDSDVDFDDFNEFMIDLFGENEYIMPEPKMIKPKEFEAIPQIQQMRKEEHALEEQYAELKKRKEELEKQKKILNLKNEIQKLEGKLQEDDTENLELQELKRQKEELKQMQEQEKLKQEIDQMQQKLAEQQREDSYYTEKPDKDGIVKLRKEKYQQSMKELQIEELRLKSLIIRCVDPRDRGEAKEKLKDVQNKMKQLKMIKTQTTMKNIMVKLPRWINKATSSIGEISKGLGSMGGEMGSSNNNTNYYVGDNPFDLNNTQNKTSNKTKKSKKGKKSKKSKKSRSQSPTDDYDYNFGFNEKDFFKGI